MKAHVLYLCALSSAVIFSADTRAFLYSNSFTDNPQLVETNQTFESESQVTLFLESPALNNSYKTAGVYFITNNKGQVFSSIGSEGEFEDQTKKLCENLEYKVTASNCASGTMDDPCPYNSDYFKICCDASYKYDKSSSSSSSSSGSGSSSSARYGGTATGPSISGNLGGLEKGQAEINPCLYPQTLSEESCGGKYRCECKTSYFPFSVCDEPQIKGETCSDSRGTRYASCTCPTSVEAPYDCKTYYAAPCGDICKEAYEDTCHRYEGKGVKDTYGCEEYFDNVCKSICKKAYKDGCHRYPEALDSCPAGATCTYYSDCSSKVKSFTCPSGFEKTNTACLFPMPVVYGDKTVTREFLSGKTPIAVVFDEKNANAIGLVEIKMDGKPAQEKICSLGSVSWTCPDGIMTWSNIKDCDIPELENCDFQGALRTSETRTNPENYIQCAPDGKENTAIILAKTTCKGTYYAAEACYKFEPTGCSDDFCRAKEWFLPSPYEWVVLYSNWSKVQATLKLLKSYGAMDLQRYDSNNKAVEKSYHTSVERYFDSVSWEEMVSNLMKIKDSYFLPWSTRVTSDGYSETYALSSEGHRTRPVIRYGEANYPDRCDNAMETCPSGANCARSTKCPTKVISWECKRGLEKSDNVCLFPLPIVYDDRTVSKEYSLLADKTPIGIVFDETNKLAVALTDVKEDGSAGSEQMVWSVNYCNIPDLEDCTSITYGSDKNSDGTAESCGVDGRTNTDAMLAYGSCGGTPAATACNLYQPSGCTANFCQKGKWFLPSMRDLNNIYLQKAQMKATLKSLASKGAQVMDHPYWSSTESYNSYKWYMSDGFRSYDSSYDNKRYHYVRPVFKYFDDKETLSCAVANCTQCSPTDSNKCITCQDGYEVNASTGKCDKTLLELTCAVPHCAQCSPIASNRCLICQDGYEVNTSTGKCDKLTEPTCKVVNCTKCVTGDPNSCEKCAQHYDLDLSTGLCKYVGESLIDVCPSGTRTLTCNSVEYCCAEGLSCSDAARACISKLQEMTLY